jgi:uncharacterized tannase-like protein DUF6351
MSSRRLLGGVALAASVALSSSAIARSAEHDAGPGRPSHAVTIAVLSNRADLISGGDALIELLLPAGVSLSSLSIDRDGQDVTSDFAIRPSGRTMGVVTGLAVGTNVLTVRGPRVATSSVTIVNRPNGGPLSSGPPLQPWTCRNAAAVDEQCNQPAVYSYFYKPTDPLKNGLYPYDPSNPPSDVATTTTDQGVTVPFIVRQETGYQDRDQYRIAVLFQPGKPWTGPEPQEQFNHKLLINHGASCGVDYESGNAPSVLPGNETGIPLVGVSLPIGLPIDFLDDATEGALGKGFAVMSTALDNSGHNCNVALQAESLIMAKERVIEQYGELRYTIGEGCSGGSLAAQWIANAYPGVYQGILPTCSFPDAWSTATQFADYHLLLAYFLDLSKWGTGVVWAPTQMADVQGHLTIVNSEVSDQAQFHVAVPTDPCSGVSDEQRYDPQTNPGGVRCSVVDAAINLFGPRPPQDWSDNEKKIGRGFAGFPVDNVGVQYGLRALQQGRILPAQFVDLNAKIGGLDIDTNPIAQRAAATRPALANAYRTGMINETNNLDRTAIIDCRGPDPGAFHDSYRAFAVRARLDREHGGHANQVIWEGPILILGDNECAINSFIAMDRWLSRVEQDPSPTPLPQKLVANKPAELRDACFDGLGQKLFDGLCPDVIVPVYGTPRMVAGDAITTDTNKCQLKPLDRKDDYGLIPFTADQWAKMEAIFPDGVCDFSCRGVDQQPTIPWLTYQDDAGNVIYGGQPLPSPPPNSGDGWAGGAFQVFSAP